MSTSRSFVSIHEAYLSVLRDIYENPDFFSSPRGQNIREKMNYQFTVMYPVSEPIRTLDQERNKVIASYTSKEHAWYDSGSLDVNDAAAISKFWAGLVNPDGKTINSNYGFLVNKDASEGNQAFNSPMKTPFEWARDKLLQDIDTRQAIVRFNKPKHCFDGNKDFVCTMYGNFHIRNNSLHFVVRMRSTDMHFGLVYDMPYFIHIQDMMLAELKGKYPSLEKGFFTFSSDSIHIYERSFTEVKKMLGVE